MKILNTIFLLISLVVVDFLGITFGIIPLLNASSTGLVTIGIFLIVIAVYLNIFCAIVSIKNIIKWKKYKKRLKDVIGYEET